MNGFDAGTCAGSGVRPGGHPAPERHQVKTPRLLASLFGSPLAWLMQMLLSEPLVAQACYPHRTPLQMPQLPAALPSLEVMLGIITGLALAVAITCTLLAWTTLRATHRSDQEATHTVEHGGGRAGFLAVLAFMVGLLFVVAIVISGLPLLLISPCRVW